MKNKSLNDMLNYFLYAFQIEKGPLFLVKIRIDIELVLIFLEILLT